MTVNGMKCLIILFSCTTVCLATFFGAQSTAESAAYNICVFSKDPSKYTPNCYPCPQSVYIKAMFACVNATSMPSNITYDSATCMEKNCQINYPTPKPIPTLDKASVFEALSKIFSMSRMARSIIGGTSTEEGTQNEVPQTYWKIIKNINTYASDYENIELDYAT